MSAGADDDPIARARALDSPTAARELYDEWAERYDHDVFERAQVAGSRRVAELLAEHVDDRATPVVDLGCGTGAVGRHLAAQGFSDLTGVDLSSGMLAIAERTGVYRRLLEADLTHSLDLTQQLGSGRFGASVSAGTFTTGHVTAAAVRHLLTALRPGAVIVWAIAPTMWPDFRMVLNETGVDIVSSAAEPIRPGTDDRSHMVVGMVVGTATGVTPG